MKLSIGRKILGSFLLILLCIIVSITIIRVETGTINSQTKQTQQVSVPAIEKASKLKGDLADLERLLLAAFATDEPKEITRLLDNVVKAQGYVDTDMKEYEPLLTTEEEKSNFKSAYSKYQEYAKYLPQLMQAIKSGDVNTFHQIQAKAHPVFADSNDLISANLELSGKIVNASTKLISDKVSVSENTLWSLTILVIAMSLILVFYLTKVIVKPLVTVSNISRKIAEGDLTVEKLTIESKDEIGELANSFNEMLDNLKTLIGQVGINSQQVAATSEELAASAEETTRATELITNSIQEIAVGSEKQVEQAQSGISIVNNILFDAQKTANAAHEVAQLSQSANERASEGSNIAIKTVEQMGNVRQTVESTSSVINELGEKSKEIGQIVAVITEIANQTNLLALNAAIEAARAGEHGAGFAVVADEVRKLAEESKKAAGNISQLITSIQGESDKAVHSMQQGMLAVQDGIVMVNRTKDSFTEIADTISTIASKGQEVNLTVENINNVLVEMQQSVEAIDTISKMSASSTQNIAASAEEQNASMEEMSASATALSRMAEELRDIISKFKL